jgi:hypothetical protein
MYLGKMWCFCVESLIHYCLTSGDSWPAPSRLAVLRLMYALFLDPIVADSSVASAASALLDVLLRSFGRDANATFSKRIVRISDSAQIKSLAAEFEREAFQPLCEAILLHTSADIGSLLRVAAWWPSSLLGPANQNADGAFAHRSLQWLAAVALRLCFLSDAPDSTQLACRVCDVKILCGRFVHSNQLFMFVCRLCLNAVHHHYNTVWHSCSMHQKTISLLTHAVAARYHSHARLSASHRSSKPFNCC